MGAIASGYFVARKSPFQKVTLLAQFAHTTKLFVFYRAAMTTDWNEARLDRLGKRIDRIEDERRKEKQRSFNRLAYAMLAILWMMAIANIVLAIVKAAN
jgi:hypothetical protein